MLVWDRNMLVWDRNMLVWDGNMLVWDRNVHIRDQNMHLQCFGTGFRGLLDLDIDFWPDPGSMNKDPKHWSLLFTGNRRREFLSSFFSRNVSLFCVISRVVAVVGSYY